MQLVGNKNARAVCEVSDLVVGSGVCVLVQGQQVALYYLPQTDRKIFALDNWDPIGKANVLSRGIIGCIGGKPIVASPLYKQHFDLHTGCCLEDQEVSVVTYNATLVNDTVCVEMS